MSNTDWYRNTQWNEEIEKDFFTKLNRSRSKRDQHLVIQALSLTKNYPEVTLQLINHY